jgi:hypothetical protein
MSNPGTPNHEGYTDAMDGLYKKWRLYEPVTLVSEIVAALEGDSNDAEHDALVAVADWLGIRYNILEDK